MRIKIRPFLSLRKSMGDQSSFEIQGEGLTIRTVLADLSEKYGLEIDDLISSPETPPVTGSTKILINGRNYHLLQKSLDSKLEEGDEISIFPPMAGG